MAQTTVQHTLQTTARCPARCSVRPPQRTVLLTAAAAQYEDFDAAPARPQGGRGRGRGGGGYGGRGGGGGYNNSRGGYNNNNNSSGYGNQQQDRSGYGGYGGPASYEARRGPVSYDEEGEGGGGGSSDGGRGGGRGRGGRGGGYSRGGGQQQRERRGPNPEAVAVNESINAANSWRELQTILEQQSRSGLQGLDPFQLVALLLKLLKLDKPTQGDDVADYQQFVASVYGWIMDRMPRFRGRQISGALYAISRLNLYNGELVTALVQASLPILHEFSAMEYVRFLDGLQRLQVAPPEEWTSQFFRSSAEKIVRTAERDELPAIFSFCQRLGMAPTPEWLATTTSAALNQLTNRDRMMRVAEYRRLIAGLAGLGWRPSPEQLETIVSRSYPQLQSGYFQVHDLVEVAWALAQWETPMPPNWAKVFAGAMMRQRRHFRPADLGSVLYSLAYLRAGPEPHQLQQLLDDLRIQFDDATGDDLANVAMALVQFGYKPDDRYMDDFLITLKAKLPTCTATGLSNAMSALPAMGSGYRLNEVAADAQARYDALMAAQQWGGPAAVEAADAQQVEVAAAVAEEQQQQQQEQQEAVV
ncbi:hypothetical protein OEZ85_010392 [Tetradesmus obliquus]|uniref:Uncharacterized protein n=1 Tax=Tetradesmus obliquus TaxID=3088 RepID=A0ABY8TMQ8_TETOB|nr:hypothetical protein OEZ85_010392 [Tetradesmus obliquus]